MKSSLKRLYSYAKDYWKHFIVAIVATLFLAGIESLIAWSIKPITDSMLNHSNLSWYIKTFVNDRKKYRRKLNQYSVETYSRSDRLFYSYVDKASNSNKLL